MPLFPFGGITLIVNIAILLIGALIRGVVRRKHALAPMWALFRQMVGKEGDTPARRVLSWCFAFSIFIFLFSALATGIMMTVRDESNNYMLVANTFEYRRALADESAENVSSVHEPDGEQINE